MADRFERLFELPYNLYSYGSPVIVSAGALLKDTQTGSIVVQLKYQSVSAVPIKALRIDVVAYDVAGGEIQGKKNFQYLDLSVQNGQTFGNNKAIVMPDVTTRSFSIGNLNVVLSDGCTVAVSLPLESLPESPSLQQALGSSELVKQYRIETNENVSIEPCEALGLWKCACGEWNHGGKCTKCSLMKDTAFNVLSHESLLAKTNIRLEEEKRTAKEQADLKSAQEIQRKARNKKLAVVLAGVVAAMAGVIAYNNWVYPTFIIPRNNYEEANRLLQEGKYSEAATAFEALGDYKDSPERLEDVVTYMMDDIYEYGIQLLQAGNYELAIEQFEGIINYKEASTKIEEAKSAVLEREYAEAQKLLSEGKYEDAIAVLSEISSYNDSQDLINSAHYHIGMQLLDDNQYTNAYKEFVLSNNHENSIDTARQWLLKKMQYANRISESVQGTDSHLVGLCSDGTVVSVDGRLVRNEYGENNVAQWKDVVSICADSFLTFGVRSNGTVLATGRDVYGECKVSGWKNISKVFSGFSHTVGLRTDGTVVAVGNNERGQCNVESWTNIVDIIAYQYITIGLRSDGKLCITGQYSDNNWVYGALGWDNVVDVAADIYAGCILGLTSDGKVLAVSKDHFDLPPELGSETVIDICVDDAAFFLTESGKVYYVKIADNWYYDDGIEDEQNIIAISADRNHFVGLRADGTVFVTGYHDYSDRDVEDWRDIIAVKALNRILVGITANGKVLIAGDDSDDLDVSEWTNIYIPN